MTRPAFFLFSLLVLACSLVLAGCGRDACSEIPTGTVSSPEIKEFDLHSQLPGDPWTLVFSYGFADSDGDLSGGRAEFFLNGERSDTSVLLFEIFRQSGVEPTAIQGEIAIPLRFEDTVQSGAGVNLGSQLVDNAENRSNCYSFDLSFAVEPVTE